jgi:O-antigen/teichoic acid export membrane protein
MSHSIAEKAVRNSVLSGLRLVVGVAATTVTSSIIARMLGPGDMGAYGYVTWLVGTLAVIANIGLPMAITKYVSEFMGSGAIGNAISVARRLLRAQLYLALGVSGLTICFAPFSTSYRRMIAIAAVMLCAQAIQQSLTAALAGAQRFDQMARVGIYTGLIQMFLVGIAGLLHAGILGMLAATLAGLWAGTLLSYRAVKEHLFKLGTEALPAGLQTQYSFNRIIRFSFTLTYILLLDTIVWQRSEVLFLKSYSTLPEIAFYTLAYAIASKLNEVGGAVSSMLLPLFSESHGRGGQSREQGQVLAAGLKYLQVLLVPLCMFVVVLCRPLILLLYGRQYLPLVLPLQILIASVGFTSLGVVNSTFVLGTERQAFIAKFGSLVAVVNIALDLILIPTHGALGAAIANCTAQILGVSGGMIYVSRCLQTKFPWAVTLTTYSAAALATAVAARLFRVIQPGIPAFVISFGVMVAIYIFGLVLCGVVSRRDLIVVRGAIFGEAPIWGRVMTRES